MENNKKQHKRTMLGETFAFIMARKAYWLLPVILFLLLLAALVFIGTSPVSPFIYPMI